MEDKTGGQAFPSKHTRNIYNEHDERTGTREVLNKGMTLRDYFAGQALCGFCVQINFHGSNNQASNMAKNCYELADAMLKEREK